MSLRPVPFFSSVLYARKTFYVYLPPGYETSGRSYPVIYLLHGLHGGETDWVLRGNGEETFDRMIASGQLGDCIAVMPGDGGYGHGTFYLDWYDGTGNFEQYFVEDLVRFVDTEFRTIRNRESRAVGGFSMGGFGAVSLALRHPHLFGLAASISGAVGSVSALPYKEFVRSEFPRILGPASGTYARERDLYLLAARRLEEGSAPLIYLNCGEGDYLVEINRLFKRMLAAADYPAHYEEHAGTHEWDYAAAQLPAVLRFAASRLAPFGHAEG